MRASNFYRYFSTFLSLNFLYSEVLYSEGTNCKYRRQLTSFLAVCTVSEATCVTNFFMHKQKKGRNSCKIAFNKLFKHMNASVVA